MAGFYVAERNDRERVVVLTRVADNTGGALWLDDEAIAALPQPTGTMPFADIVTYAAAVKDLAVYTIPYDAGKGPLYISTQPTSQSVAAGTNVTLTVAAAAGTGTKTYQWYYQGFKIDGTINPTALTASLVNNAVTKLSNGDYWCVVSSTGEQVTSRPATLTVAASLITAVGQTQYSADGETWANTIPDGVMVAGAPVDFWVRTNPASLDDPDDGDYVFSFAMAAVGSGGISLINDMRNRARITGTTPVDQVGLTFSVNCSVKDSAGTSVTGAALEKDWE
ncbi:MAG: immunoglobulin domain-containing protein [Cetobacterium sp.]